MSIEIAREASPNVCVILSIYITKRWKSGKLRIDEGPFPKTSTHTQTTTTSPFGKKKFVSKPKTRWWNSNSGLSYMCPYMCSVLALLVQSLTKWRLEIEICNWLIYGIHLPKGDCISHNKSLHFCLVIWWELSNAYNNWRLRQHYKSNMRTII